jgi:hypothetical protein
MVQRYVFIDVTRGYHTYLHFTQNSRNDVACSQRKMTVFLVYVLPSSNISLLTVMQAEIPGQDQGGYDTEPNFFHGMHQVRAIADSSPFLSHIINYSILRTPAHDLNSAIGA